MDYSHIHLFMNHIPIWGGIFAFLFFVYSTAKKRNDLFKFSLWFFIVIALATIIVYLTGEPAGEPIKNLPGIGEDIIDKHEEASLLPFILIEVLGAASIAGLILIRKTNMQKAWFTYPFIIISFVFLVSLAYAANLGGQIRHTEIRSGQVHTENPVKSDK
jgi:uncharacterized membrane protein